MNEDRNEKRDKWACVLRDWEKSETSAAAYCRSNDIPACQFNYWKKRLRPRGNEKEGRFVKLPFAQERHRGDSGLSFELPSGLRLVIEGGFDADELLRVLKVVGGGEC